MERVKKLLFNNYFLALLISLPFLLLIQSVVPRYKLEEIRKIDIIGERQIQYQDLDNDGFSEKILFESNVLGNACLKIYNPGHQGQFNSDSRSMPGPTKNQFGDINNDGIKDIMFLGEKDSAVFLNIFDYRTRVINSYYVDSVRAFGTQNYNAFVNAVLDFDMDGFNDVLVSISAGFSLNPRALYLIHPHGGKNLETPFQGSMLNDNIVNNIDNDPFPEILVSTYAYRNQTSPVPITDSCSWLIVLNHSLEYKFDPVRISCNKSYATVFPFIEKTDTFICCVSNIIDSYQIPNRVLLFSSKGKVLAERNFEKGSPDADFRVSIFSDEGARGLFYLRIDGTLFRLDNHLNMKRLSRKKHLANSVLAPLEIIGEGMPGKTFQKIGINKWVFTDQNFNYPVEWEPQDKRGKVIFSKKLNGNEKPTIFIQTGTTGTELSYRINPWWYGQYGIYAGIWLFFYLLILLVSRIQKAKLRQQMALQEQMNELQYRVITSQFSPHYTFNVLNAISAKLYGNHPELYDYIMRFSRQLRYLYAGKNELSRTLREELEFCRDYLEIQKLRFSGKFDYSIHLSEEVSQEIIIPKMLIFTFLENALKHGLRAMESGGFIGISGAKENGQVILKVTDNGIGRKAAEEYLKENPAWSTGKGLELLEKLVEQMNRAGKGKIGWEIRDLGQVGQGGTTVILTIAL